MSRPYSKLTKEPNLMVQAHRAEMDTKTNQGQPKDEGADENAVPDYPLIFWAQKKSRVGLEDDTSFIYGDAEKDEPQSPKNEVKKEEDEEEGHRDPKSKY